MREEEEPKKIYNLFFPQLTLKTEFKPDYFRPISTHTKPEERDESLQEHIGGRSASSISARVELAEPIKFNIWNRTITLGGFKRKVPGGSFLYNDQLLTDLAQPILDGNFDETIKIGDESIGPLIEQYVKELPQFATETVDAVQNLWDQLYTVLEPRAGELGFHLYVFFQDLLPQYTSDGIITPTEAYDIAVAMEEYLRQFHDTVLTEEERQQVDAALNDFSAAFNNIANKYTIDDKLRAMMGSEDPLSMITIGPIPLKDYYNMFTQVLPLFKSTVTENSFTLKGTAHARGSIVSDYFNSYIYKNHVFRHGTLSSFKGVGSVTVDVTGEFHAGKPLRDFISEEDLSQESYEKLVTLLGYEPVMLDGSINGTMKASALMENLYLRGFEKVTQKKGHMYGVGVAPGFVLRTSLFSNASISAYEDSFKEEIKGSFEGELGMQTEVGRHTRLYFVSRTDTPKFWHSVYGGFILENLLIHQRNYHAAFDIEANFKGEYHAEFSNSKDEKKFFRNSLKPILALTAGMRRGERLNPFVYGNYDTEEFGVGAYFNTSSVAGSTRIGFPGFVEGDVLIPIRGSRINTRATEDYHLEKTHLMFSPFPATNAMLWDAQRKYYSKLQGTFIEASIKNVHEPSFPHEVPTLATTGLVFSKNSDAYFRVGGITTFTQRAYGSYLTIGTNRIAFNAAFMHEEIGDRNSSANRADFGANISLGKGKLHLNSNLVFVPNELGPFLGAENPTTAGTADSRGEIRYNIMYEF